MGGGYWTLGGWDYESISPRKSGNPTRIKIPPCSYDIPIVILHFVISATFFFQAGTAFGHGIPGRWKLGRRAWHAARPMWVAGANIGENNGKHTCIHIKPWHMWYDLIIVDHIWSILLYGSYHSHRSHRSYSVLYKCWNPGVFIGGLGCVSTDRWGTALYSHEAGDCAEHLR